MKIKNFKYKKARLRHEHAWNNRIISPQCLNFFYEYEAFNIVLKQIKFPNLKTDRDCIEKFKTSYFAKKYIKLVRNYSNLSDMWKEIIKYLDENPLRNVTRGKNYWKDECGKIQSIEDFEDMVEFWYVIRNNLFHWYKVLDNQRDLKLLEYGYKTLRPLVALFIEKLN